MGAHFNRNREALRRHYGRLVPCARSVVRRCGQAKRKPAVTGGAVFGVVLLAALCLSGTMMPRIVRRFPGLSARLTMMQQGLEILRTWRTLQVIAITMMIYVPDALTLWL